MDEMELKERELLKEISVLKDTLHKDNRHISEVGGGLCGLDSVVWWWDGVCLVFIV